MDSIIEKYRDHRSIWPTDAECKYQIDGFFAELSDQEKFDIMEWLLESHEDIEDYERGTNDDTKDIF